VQPYNTNIMEKKNIIITTVNPNVTHKLIVPVTVVASIIKSLREDKFVTFNPIYITDLQRLPIGVASGTIDLTVQTKHVVSISVLHHVPKKDSKGPVVTTDFI
jgi:hypothetical protein